MEKKKRIKRTSWIDFAFSIIIFTLVVTGGYFIFSSINQPDDDQHIVSASTIIDSHYKGIKISTETSNDELKPFAVQYPQSNYQSFNESILSYIEQAKEDYFNEMDDFKKSKKKTPGELNVSFETVSQHSGFYTFVFKSETFTGGTNEVTNVQTFHLQPESGKEFSLKDLLKSDIERLEKVAEIVKTSLVEDDSLKDYLILEELDSRVEATWDNFQNFAISDDSLTFYFNKYEVTAGAAGMPVVSIPLSEIDHLLADNFKEVERNDFASNEEEESDETSTNDSTEENSNSSSEEKNSDGNDSTKRVALTFDDGPHPDVTPQILNSLKKYNAKATFFMLGSRAEFYPEIAERVAEEGHELGNHTWNHPDLTKAGAEKIRNEIGNTTSIIEQVTGKKVTAFRPPYGAVNDAVRAQTKLPIVLWDVDTLDWKHRNSSQLLSYVKNQTREDSIILMHDIHQATADSLDAVLHYLQSEGYSFVTVSEID